MTSSRSLPKLGLRIVAGATAAFVVVASAWLFDHCLTCAKIQDEGTAEFTIPYLAEGFVPQGLEYVTAYEGHLTGFLMSGYQSDGSASPLVKMTVDDRARMLVPEDRGQAAERITLENPDGTTCTGHNGGIAADGARVFVVNEDGVLSFGLDDVLGAFDDDTIRATHLRTIDFNPAFVECHEGLLFVGEYADDGDYAPDASHYCEAPDGTTYRALIYVFAPDATAPDGYAATPSLVLAIPDGIQGMCFADDGGIYLARSLSALASKVYRFELDGQLAAATLDEIATEQTFQKDGWSAGLAFLDEAHLVATHDAPPMIEEIALVDDRLFVNCEAAANKYLIGKLYGAETLYSFAWE